MNESQQIELPPLSPLFVQEFGKTCHYVFKAHRTTSKPPNNIEKYLETWARLAAAIKPGRVPEQFLRELESEFPSKPLEFIGTQGIVLVLVAGQPVAFLPQKLRRKDDFQMLIVDSRKGAGRRPPPGKADPKVASASMPRTKHGAYSAGEHREQLNGTHSRGAFAVK